MLFGSNLLKMLWIYASTIVACMMDMQSINQISDKQIICKPMRTITSTLKGYVSITSWVLVAVPFPASIRVDRNLGSLKKLFYSAQRNVGGEQDISPLPV